MNITQAVLIGSTLLRIVGVLYCIKRAEYLNRNAFLWGIFGFFMPLLAMIIIVFLKDKDELLEIRVKKQEEFNNEKRKILE